MRYSSTVRYVSGSQLQFHPCLRCLTTCTSAFQQLQKRLHAAYSICIQNTVDVYMTAILLLTVTLPMLAYTSNLHCTACHRMCCSNRLGVWSCLRCKIAFCDTHVKSKMNQTLAKNQAYKCKVPTSCVNSFYILYLRTHCLVTGHQVLHHLV